MKKILLVCILSCSMSCTHSIKDTGKVKAVEYYNNLRKNSSPKYKVTLDVDNSIGEIYLLTDSLYKVGDEIKIIIVKDE